MQLHIQPEKIPIDVTLINYAYSYVNITITLLLTFVIISVPAK